MDKIKKINSRQIFDSRGIPTLEVEIFTDNGYFTTVSVPSGTSVSKYEALELRDNYSDKFDGLGVTKAVNNINNIISPSIIGKSIFSQIEIDKFLIDLDGSNNKKYLGANSLLGVSLAIAKVASISLGIPLFKYIGGISTYKLPVPIINIINGGRHSNSGIPFQEFMIIPVGFDSFYDAISSGIEIFNKLKIIMNNNNLSTSVGYEGGFTPSINNIDYIFKLLVESIDKSNYILGKEIFLGIDLASSEFYKNGIYDYSTFCSKNKIKFTTKEHIDYICDLVSSYPIILLEDPLSYNDIYGWKYITNLLKDKIFLVGDDLFSTNINLLNNGINDNIANSIIIKPNQIGTLFETIDVVNKSLDYNYTCIMSHRSGETEDNIISDLSVGLKCDFIKSGSVSRSDRLSKYNQLIRIEDKFNGNSKYVGNKIFRNIK